MDTWFLDGEIDLKDHREAVSRMLNWLVEEELGSKALPTDRSFDTASVLARFSTSDPAVVEARSDAVSEIVSMYIEGNAGREQILDLLHTMSPELSINERRKAADELNRIAYDGTRDAAETEEGVLYLATLI